MATKSRFPLKNIGDLILNAFKAEFYRRANAFKQRKLCYVDKKQTFVKYKQRQNKILLDKIYNIN